MITDLFYIVLFVSAFGSAAWVLVLLIQHVFKIRIPFCLCPFMLAFYLFPLFSPGVRLVAENPRWLQPFRTASGIWAAGLCLSFGYLVFRNGYAGRMVRGYAPCREESVIRILRDCAVRMKMKRLPEILYGDWKDPACVIFLGSAKIILSERMVQQLSRQELAVILTHELSHIRRGHLFWRSCFDWIVCVHWFNPLVWAARREFCLCCEMDCDQTVFRVIPELSAADYANLMLKMRKLSLPNRRYPANAIGSLDFLLAKQRLQSILSPASAVRKGCSVLLSLAILMAVTSGSLSGSQNYFYPASAGSTRMERSADHA